MKCYLCGKTVPKGKTCYKCFRPICEPHMARRDLLGMVCVNCRNKEKRNER